MVCQPNTVKIWTNPTRWLKIPFPRWSIFSQLPSISCCHTPLDSTSYRALASGHHLVHNSKSPCVEQMAWRNRVTAALPYKANSCVKPRKPFHDDHPIAHAPVILSSSDHSTVPRSPQTMECDRGNRWQVSTYIVYCFNRLILLLLLFQHCYCCYYYCFNRLILLLFSTNIVSKD